MVRQLILNVPSSSGASGYPCPSPATRSSRPNPQTWRFRHKDKDVSALPQPNQTSSPEPPDIFDIGNESMFYPLAGSLVMAAAALRGQGLPRFWGPRAAERVRTPGSRRP